MSDTKLMEQLEAMRVELETLRRDHDVLRAAVERSHVSNSPSLRERLRCAHCGGTTILHALQVLDRGHSNTALPMGIHRPSVWRSRIEGEFEVYVCRGCGFTEWYVKDASTIKADGKRIRELDGSRGPGAGYR